MVKKSLDEVTKFHGELLETRNARLRKELARHKSELKEIDTQITSLGKRMDELEGEKYKVSRHKRIPTKAKQKSREPCTAQQRRWSRVNLAI